VNILQKRSFYQVGSRYIYRRQKNLCYPLEGRKNNFVCDEPTINNVDPLAEIIFRLRPLYGIYKG